MLITQLTRIREVERNLAAALETDEEIDRGDSIVISTIKYILQYFLNFQNYYWFRFAWFHKHYYPNFTEMSVVLLMMTTKVLFAKVKWIFKIFFLAGKKTQKNEFGMMSK